MKLKLILLLFFLGTALLAQVNVKIETLFTLNDEKTTQKEYMFKWPKMIVSDKQYNFYVFDYEACEIKKFSKEGKFLKAIGRTGAGPGEYKHLSDMYINTHNEITVHDPQNYRITDFDLNGKYLRSRPSKYTGTSIKVIGKYDDLSYLTVQGNDKDEINYKNKIFICKDDFENSLTSFGHSSIFWKYEDVFQKHMDDRNALNLAVSNNNVIAAKEFYDGKIYFFDKNKRWEMKIIEGKQIKKPGYEVIEKSLTDLNYKDYIGGNVCFGYMWQGKHRVFSVFFRYKSLGVYSFKNEYIVNFIWSCVKPNEYEFGVDIYKADGTYIGYCKINNFGRVSFNDKVLCKDGEENFYLGGLNGIVKKFQLTIN